MAGTNRLARDSRELREVADEMLRHAIFKGDPAIATQLFLRHPEISKVDIFPAVATGNLEEVQRFLNADPGSASRAGGPFKRS